LDCDYSRGFIVGISAYIMLYVLSWAAEINY